MELDGPVGVDLLQRHQSNLERLRELREKRERAEKAYEKYSEPYLRVMDMLAKHLSDRKRTGKRFGQGFNASFVLRAPTENVGPGAAAHLIVTGSYIKTRQEGLRVQLPVEMRLKVEEGEAVTVSDPVWLFRPGRGPEDVLKDYGFHGIIPTAEVSANEQDFFIGLIREAYECSMPSPSYPDAKFKTVYTAVQA